MLTSSEASKVTLAKKKKKKNHFASSLSLSAEEFTRVGVRYLRLLMAITWSPPKSSLQVFGFTWAQSLQGCATSICKYHSVAICPQAGF